MKLLFATVLFCTVAPCWSRIQVLQSGESIQKAIHRLAPYDTLLIQEGKYKVNNLEIKKPLTIIGKGWPEMDGQGQGDIIHILSDFVTIKGLQLQNTGVSFIKEHAAIRLNNIQYAIIEDIRIRDSFFGIYVQYGKNCTIQNNSIIGAPTDYSRAGNAIHIWKGSRINILNNVTENHRDGIYFEFVDSSLIEGNKSLNNLRYGLHFMFSDNDIYRRNYFYKNGAGVAVMFSRNISMLENTFEYNQGMASYGILLKEISQGEMKRNVFLDNTVGVYAEGATSIDILHNDFISNGKAIDMKGNSLDNKIMYNNFIANTYEVYANTKSNLNLYSDNFWSQYIGYDLNRDGIGDEPYRPVSLMAIVSSHAQASYILLHSFLSSFMDLMEKIFPQIIPEMLVDNNPRMKPVTHDYH